MAYDLGAPRPVRLPRSVSPDENKEDHDASIAYNEDALNQNFTEQGNKLLDLEARLQALEG